MGRAYEIQITMLGNVMLQAAFSYPPEQLFGQNRMECTCHAMVMIFLHVRSHPTQADHRQTRGVKNHSNSADKHWYHPKPAEYPDQFCLPAYLRSFLTGDGRQQQDSATGGYRLSLQTKARRFKMSCYHVVICSLPLTCHTADRQDQNPYFPGKHPKQP